MPLKFGKKQNLVGLDIGHHSIKLVAMEPMTSGWRLTRVLSVPTPPDSVRDSIVTDPEALSQAIQTLVRNAKMPISGCHVSVAGASVVVRSVRVPKMSEAMLRKSIKFEAGRYIPSSVEDSYVEFEIAGETEDGQMDVIIGAAPRDLVDFRIKACELAGLPVESVDIEPFAAYRALVQANYNIDLNKDTVALVDFGHTSTNVSVIDKGSFAMTRTINQGGLALTEALQKYFKLSYQDAEEGKTQLDLLGLLKDNQPAENPPLRVIQPHLDDLVREMRRSLNYFQSQQAEAGSSNPVTWMLLSGGGAKMQGIADYMSNRLGLKVYAAGVFDNPRFAYVGDQFFGQGADLSVASGLAMRSYSHAA